MAIVRGLYSLVFWLFLAGSSALLYPVAVVIWACTLPFDPGKRLLHQFTCFWASLYTWLNPFWRVTVIDREKLRSDRATVIVANHLSLLDILVVFRTFAYFKWVSKNENFQIPFIGWNMSLNGYIKLKRGARGSVRRMMAACEKSLTEGSSIMMFPEGTRSLTGRMRVFKPGPFELAIRTGSPVQPILIQGTARALPKRGFVLQGRHVIRVTVLDAISPDAFKDLSARELAEQVQALIAAGLGEEQTEPPSEREDS